MKRLLTTLLAGTMALTLLSACNEQPPMTSEQPPTADTQGQEQNLSGENSVAIFRGVIEEMSDSTATVAPNDDQEHILSSGDKVKVNLSVSDGKFEVGDEIVVYYTGEIMESYPLQINTVDVELSEDFDLTIDDNANSSDDDKVVSELLPTAKIAINIEGFVTNVDGNRITLDSGKVVVITEETEFETENVGNFLAVDDEIVVGNFIQGFTLGDAAADEVTADVISSNEVLEMPMGDVVVNIEGVITEVSDDGNSFLLDSGKWVIVTDETELGITGPNAAPRDEQYLEETFRVGNSISGFTEDTTSEELIAYAIYTNWNWESPIGDSDLGIIETEIIINVTEEYDGTLTAELTNLGVVSVENIFAVEDTIMYLIKTEEPVKDIIEKLEALSFVNYAEYNQIVSITN